MKSSYDMVVIGAGNAGMAAAGVALARGRSVIVAEARDFGGTCPLRGCVPKKVLVAAAEVLDAIGRAADHHIEVASPTLDWARLIERKETFVRGVPDEFEKSLRKRGADLVSSAAVFSGEHEVTLAGQSVTFAKAVVASGSVPRPLSFDGSEHIITSDEVLTMPSRPSSVVFIGAGVIAMEFAHVLARAGSKVTLLEMLPRPLSMFDADAVAALLRENERLGIALHTKAEVQRIDKGAEGLRVRYAIDGESRSIEAACVAHGAGRIADYGPLDLAAAGVEVDERGRPRLDPQLRSTSNPDVLFAGDAVPTSPQLSPVATHEGKIAGNNATSADLETPDYRAIPSVVFTVPALAAVGLGEREAKERGHDVDCRESDPSGWRSGRTYAETNAYAKVLIDNKDGALLGAHLFGHGAQETIHAFSFLLRHRLPAKELKEMVAAYPTFHADLAHFV